MNFYANIFDLFSVAKALVFLNFAALGSRSLKKTWRYKEEEDCALGYLRVAIKL
jgi:hypothetical protein